MRGCCLLLTWGTTFYVALGETPQLLGSRLDAGPAKRTQDAPLQEVAYLNRHIFAGNALKPMGGGVEQWVVSFCPRWWHPCQKLEPVFFEAARRWQSELNTDASVVHVRFAQVDCAVDKVLCNEQRVLSYPTVAVYREGQQTHRASLEKAQVATALEQFLAKWLSMASKDTARSPSTSPSTVQAREMSALSVLTFEMVKGYCFGLEMLQSYCGQHGVDLLLTAALLFVSFRFMWCSPSRSHPQTNSTRVGGPSSLAFSPTLTWSRAPAIVEI
mmetsp:Transcript_30807/g.71108  ORF Transcript_30807/g.71108 Transcript_30807/m.71108 type:complete len:272 (-) Transcript_30807:188-1003(-)